MKATIRGYTLHGSVVALFLSCVIVVLSSAINLPNHSPKVTAPLNSATFGMNAPESVSSLPASVTQKSRPLTFADRVAYQRLIEEVYWRHRIWPKANAGLKPPLDCYDNCTSDSNGYGNSDANRNCESQTYTNAKARTDTETASNSGTAPGVDSMRVVRGTVNHRN